MSFSAISQALSVVIVIGIILAGLGGYGFGYMNQRSVKTTTFSSTLTQTTTYTTTRIITSNASSDNETSQLYQLEFVQESNCAYGSWLLPWAVVLDNSTMLVQPSNATLPLTYNGANLTSNSNYSTIWFSVPDGTYDYSVLPSNFHGQEQSGTVTIAGSNVLVQVSAFITAMGCSSTTAVSG